ncbi:MAG: FHA domain-containing protein [Anaerolineae bacterium]|nr:FHA domain-containing protein [Anaerolineae bacterium]
MNNTYQLVIRKGPKPGQSFPLFAATATIGRDPISDIAINDPEVSRQHARLTQTSDSYQIEDLGSTNGTFVNGLPLGSAPVQLAHGNEIKLGSVITLLFELMPEDEEEGMGVETAVAAQPPEEPKSDPMLPPDFDRLSVIDDLPMADPQASMIEIQEELDTAFNEENIPPPPPPDIPRVTVSPSTVTPSKPDRNGNPARRLVAMGAALILLMMCCCCGFLVIMYQWGGDWLLQQMGLLP